MKRKIAPLFVAFPIVLASQASAPALPPPSASVSPAPQGGTAPSASGSATAGDAAPALVRGPDVPDQRSPLPKLEEWAAGLPVQPNGGALPCTYERLREYLQITCKGAAGAGLFAGSPKDTTVFASGDEDGPDGNWIQPVTVIVVPMRRGEARLFNLIAIGGGGYGAVTASTAGWISVSWLPGSADPVILSHLAGELQRSKATTI